MVVKPHLHVDDDGGMINLNVRGNKKSLTIKSEIAVKSPVS